MTAEPDATGPNGQASDEPPPLLPVEPGYKAVVRVRLAITWLPLIIGAAMLENLLAETIFYGMLSTAVLLIALVAVAVAPQRIYRHLRYRLTGDYLQVLRGWMFHSDTIVPLVRVQHLDVTRGPLDKLFGTASLVVHTAGTHNSIVTVPGLAPDRAEGIREVIREQVRTDVA